MSQEVLIKTYEEIKDKAETLRKEKQKQLHALEQKQIHGINLTGWENNLRNSIILYQNKTGEANQLLADKDFQLSLTENQFNVVQEAITVAKQVMKMLQNL